MKVNLTEIKVGDVFSEESHYIVKEVKKDNIVFEHLERMYGYGHQKNRKRDWRKICKYKYDFTSYL